MFKPADKLQRGDIVFERASKAELMVLAVTKGVLPNHVSIMLGDGYTWCEIKAKALVEVKDI